MVISTLENLNTESSKVKVYILLKIQANTVVISLQEASMVKDDLTITMVHATKDNGKIA